MIFKEIINIFKIDKKQTSLFQYKNYGIAKHAVIVASVLSSHI
jgi:hypothetical protein